MARKKRGSEKELYWRSMMDRQAASGLPIAEFCAEEGISRPSFYAWRKRFRQQGEGSTPTRTSKRNVDESGEDREFISLKLRDSASSLEVLHPLGYQVRVTGEVNVQALRKVLEVLDERGAR